MTIHAIDWSADPVLNPPMSVVRMKPFVKQGSKNGVDCPVLKPLKWVLAHWREGSDITDYDSDRLWGRELAHAQGTSRTKALLRTRRGKKKDRPVDYLWEWSLRTSGHVVSRLRYRWFMDGKDIQFGWTEVAKVVPMNGHMVAGLAHAWADLGFEVTITEADWVEAALVVEMLKSMKGGDE